MNRQERAVCQEPFYIGAHRGAHTQDASFAPLYFGNPWRTSFVVANPPGNNIRWDTIAALDQYDPGHSYPFIVDENTSLGFQQLVTLAGRGVLDPAVNIIEMDPRETADSPFELVLNHDPFYNRMLAPGGTTSLPPASGWPPPIRVSSKLLCEVQGGCGVTAPPPINWGRNGQPVLSSYSGSNGIISMEQGLQKLVDFPNLVAQIHVRNEQDIVRIEANALVKGVAEQIYFDMQGRDFCREREQSSNRTVSNVA